MFEKFFHLRENGTTVKTEVLGGLATFMTMSYILFVNPAILAKAGVPFEASVTATAWAAGLSTLCMGLFTNYPIALAPGMGLNAMLAYTVILGMGLPWQTGMGVIVLEGLIVTALVLTNVREQVMDAIPLALKRAIGIGIGLFIAFIGLKDAGLIASHPATFVTSGSFREPAVWVACAGLALSSVLMLLRRPGALLLGMAGTLVLSLAVGTSHWPARWVSIPAWPETFFKFDLLSALDWKLAPVIFAFFLTDFFDTMGTVIAVGGEGGFLNEQGRLPRLRRVLLVDSLAAVAGGVFSASSVTSYIESAAGVAQGARTGLAAVVVAAAFFAAPLLTPLVHVVGGGVQTATGFANPITAPALILVGFFMMAEIRKIAWDDFEEAFPAFLVLIGMPLTFSISHGIGLGFLAHVLLKVARGKAGQVPLLLYAVAALFAASFALR